MAEYLILQKLRTYDDWIAGYCPTMGAYYLTLKRGGVQTDLFIKTKDEWKEVGYFYDNNSSTPTTTAVNKLAVTLVSAGFRLEDTLAIVDTADLCSRYGDLSPEPFFTIPKYSEKDTVGYLQERIKKIIAGGLR